MWVIIQHPCVYQQRKNKKSKTTNYISSLKRRENIQNETFKSFLLISMLTILFAKLFKEKYEASSFQSMSESTTLTLIVIIIYEKLTHKM